MNDKNQKMDKIFRILIIVFMIVAAIILLFTGINQVSLLMGWGDIFKGMAKALSRFFMFLFSSGSPVKTDETGVHIKP